MVHVEPLLLAVAGDGEEAPSVLLPALYDLIWGGLCFLILFVLFWKFVLPQFQTALDQRTEGIEKKLEKAERDRAEAETLLAQYKQQLAEARQEASRIRTDAQSDRKAIVDEARTEAQVAATQVSERSRAQMQAELAQARSELSRDVGRIAVDLAGRIVGANLSETDRTRETVERFITDLESVSAVDGPANDGRTPGAAHAVVTSPEGGR
jgi:F-type H+-transporting ATPase subunit b